MNHLKLFAGAVLETETGPVSGRAAQRHRIALLALLSTTRRLYRSRDQLVAFLWPEADAERGRKLLSDSIYRINQALGGDAITGTGEDLRLNRDQVGSDVADFEAAVDARDWRRVAEIYAGPFLDGFFLPGATEFDQWMEVERAQYLRAAAKAIEALAVDAREAGRMTEAVELWQRLAALVPDDSRVAMELMRALESAGNRAAALRHGREHAKLLRETLGVEPDRSVRDLADQIARRGNGAVGSATASVTAVPVSVTAFAGNSIAVLPFSILSGAGESAYVADGMSEELMYLLTRTPGLRVASRTSAFACRDLNLDVREVARRLQVDWIVEGSVRRSGSRLRIVAQLTDARNGYQVWSESFDRTSSDIFAVQEEMAAEIASRLSTAVVGGPSTTSLTGAHRMADSNLCDLFLQARFHYYRRTEESLRTSAAMFEHVVERDPDYARAWVGLADSYAVLAFYDCLPPRVAFARADCAARQAIRIDAKLAAPHATLGYVDTYYHWNWSSAEQRMRRAIELDPNYSAAHQWYGNLLAARGRFAEAERAMRRAVELDPLSLIAHTGIGWVFLLANQNERAIQQLESTLKLDPNFQMARYWLGVALDQQGRPAEAVATLQRALERANNCAIVNAALARAHAAAGDARAARAMLDELLERERAGRYISSYAIAKVHHALGEVPAALTRLERAYTDRAHSMSLLSMDPQLRSLADEPRFQDLMDRVSQREREVVAAH